MPILVSVSLTQTSTKICRRVVSCVVDDTLSDVDLLLGTDWFTMSSSTLAGSTVVTVCFPKIGINVSDMRTHAGVSHTPPITPIVYSTASCPLYLHGRY